MGQVDTAMILAAGRGERMRPLTDTMPKPLLPLQGKPLMQYHVESLVACGVKRIVINHAWLGEQIETAFGNGERWDIEICYSAEPAALETAGGIVNALPLLGDEAFLVVNGDVYCDVDLTAFCAQPLAGLARLLMVENPDHNPNGDFAMLNGLLTEKTPNLASVTFSGIALYAPDFFANLNVEKQPLAPLIKHHLKQQQVEAQLFAGTWCDVGTPARLAKLEEELKR